MILKLKGFMNFNPTTQGSTCTSEKQGDPFTVQENQKHNRDILWFKFFLGLKFSNQFVFHVPLSKEHRKHFQTKEKFEPQHTLYML